MDIINPSFLSAAFNQVKKKLHSNINKNDSKESSLEKTKKRKKRKEEDLIQLLSDSDELEEISPSLFKKVKAEEAKGISKMEKIIKIDNKINNHKKRRSSTKRQLSLININYPEINKDFKEEKEEFKQEGGSLNEKKTYARKNTFLYQSYPIMEEEQNEDDDNYGENTSEINSNINNFNISNKSSYVSLSKYEQKNLSQLFSRKMQFNTTKNQDKKSRRKKGSKLIERIDNLSKNIEVQLFDKKESINIKIHPSDTVKEIKKRILSELKEKKKNFTNYSIDAFELRSLDDPNESPDLDIPPLRDYVKVLGLEPKALIFLKNSEYDDSSINTSSINNISISREMSFDSSSTHQNKKNILLSSFQKKMSKDSVVFEDEDKNGPKKFEVKVYYKDIKEENDIKCVNIFLNENDTLKNILYYFFKRNLLVIKNENLYFFITHNSLEDFENGYNLNIDIKSLTPPYELDLCYKYFPDLPQALNIYQLSVNKKKIEEKIKELS